ncbi:MAG: Gfo/Idh/MocA family oxidoreductase [Spirochaetes bacterium]|nr:Gfo/Idh/MocA family oxidoreductase [Spirochaetota bacterium]
MMKVKVGIIGIGRMGQYHLNILNNLPEVQVVGISDINQDRMAELSYKFDVPGFDNYKKLIKKCDAIFIATPTSTHYEYAKECLDLEKHILLEKPMTTDIDQAKEIVQLSKKKSLILQIGHVERFNGAVQQLKKIIMNPLYIESKRIGPYDPRVSDVGVILDLMIHDIDILLNLIEDNVVEISAMGSSVFSTFEDIASVQLSFENGCNAHILAGRASQKRTRELSIMQKDSFIYLDYGTQDIEIHRMAKNAYLLTPEEIRYSQESFVEHLSVQKDNPLKLEILHFLECIKGKEKPYVANEIDIKSLTISLKAMKLISEKRKK